MGKPLSRPDCLRQNPACLGKGEEEDGYIEDCYVPQRSIYDTMRINEQIDQGSKLNQTSKSTMEKIEGSTISSNGTLGAASNVFESRAPESKKLDERIIFDALKLSSDVQKSAPVPPRRRPNAERKDNINRRSWKSFMPPNFPEFAERMEASLSEVSEAGASNPSLQEKKESSSLLTESSGHLDHKDPRSESLTLEHISKSIGIPEVQEVKNLSVNCHNLTFQQDNEFCHGEFQLLESEAAPSGDRDVTQEQRYLSATWPRAMKSLVKGSFSDHHHHPGEAAQAACTVEMSPLSPCMSEELLDSELHILITPSLREKTESELKFEEDERWIMMETEELEEEKLSEREKTTLLTDEKRNCWAEISEEREQEFPVEMIRDVVDCSASVLGTKIANHPPPSGQVCCCDDGQPEEDHLASIPQDLHLGYSCVLTDRDVICEVENTASQHQESLIPDSECFVSPAFPEQFSDTDSVQMFLELEKQCLCEEAEILPFDLENPASLEGLTLSQDEEKSLLGCDFLGAASGTRHHVPMLNHGSTDALNCPQVSVPMELGTQPDTKRETSTLSTGGCEKVPFSPRAAEEPKLVPQTDTELLEELNTKGSLTPDQKDSCEEKGLAPVVLVLAQQDSYLSLTNASKMENTGEDGQRLSPKPVFNCEQVDYTLRLKEQEFLQDSCLLKDEVSLESGEIEKIPEENDQVPLKKADSLKLPPRKNEPVGYENHIVKEQAWETRHLDGQIQAPSSRYIPEQVLETQKELDSLGLFVQMEGVRLDTESLESASHAKQKWSVASEEADLVGRRNSSLLFLPSGEREIVRDPLNGNIGVAVMMDLGTVMVENVPVAAMDIIGNVTPTNAVPVYITSEDSSAAAVCITGDEAPSAAVPIVEGDAPKAEEDAPSAVALVMGGDDSNVAMPTTGKEAPSVVVPTMEEDTPRAVVPVTREDAPKATVSVTGEEAPSDVVLITGENASSAAVLTMEYVVSNGLVSVTEESAPSAAVPITGEDAPSPAVPTMKDDAPSALVSITREDVPTVPITGEEVAPCAARSIMGEDVPIITAPSLEGFCSVVVSPLEDPPADIRILEYSAFTLSAPVVEEAAPTVVQPTEALANLTPGIELPGTMLYTEGSLDVPNELVYNDEMFQKEQVDPLQMKLQQVNGLGQGLIQSAGKNCDVQGLEHDIEEINARWNTLNKKVAQRIAQLQEALLHCGKFQDALEPLLSWLADTEDLIANQKPPSAEYKVVKAQIQEQKLLQRLLDDRKATVDMLQAEGERIAQSAELADREKIMSQLESLGRRWTELLSKAAARQKQLEDILVLAKQFHETAEPVSDFLSVTEKKLANSEPVGTQTAKIQQQIVRHKALEEEIESRAADVQQAVRVGQSLSSLTCPAEQGVLADRLEALQAHYSEVQDWCCRKAALLEQAVANARLFGEDEVEVLNWLAEAEDKLSSVFVKDYRQDVLQKQHADHLALNEEIVNRKKNVDQAIKNGQALLKQTTGEEVLLIQEKLDGIKTRYADLTVSSSKALRTLEQARQLATKFQATHDELTGWLSKVEAELTTSGGQSPKGEQIPQFQQRQKELKKEVMEHRLVLDTVNEVSRALLELVPWRAREGLDKLVSDANDQYKLVSDTIGQRVDEIDAAIQRSQQYEQAADAELAWVAETKRKLMALGPVRLEQDQTTAQLQVQKAFSIDIIRHKDSMDELFSQRSDIFGTCGEEQKAVLQEKTESLVQQYEAISQLNSERYACLERAQVLVNQFWETHEELSPWIEETQALIAQLPPPAIDHEQLKQQQEEMRQLRESIAEHKPHIDKLLKIGPQLKELNPDEGEMVQEKYQTAEATYARIKEEVRRRALALDEAISQSAQFHDKMEPMLETLENLSSRLRIPPLIPAEVDKIRECLSENKGAAMELEKLQPSFEALKRRGEELIGRSQGADKDLAAKEIQDKLDQMVFFWEDIKARAEEREIKFLDVLELAEKFWYDMAALLTTIKDTQDIVHDLESPGIDPSIIKQQVEAAETIKEETDGLHEELEFIRILGADLIFACGETEKPEVKKSIDELNNAWENLNKTWRERLEKLEEAMQAAVQYQDTLQTMFDWLDNTVIKLCNMPPVGTDLNTVKDQLNEMKEFKMEVYQQQIEMEKLNHQGELMLKKATDETDRDIIREPLTELKHLWENLGEKIAHRQHKLEGALLALGQFQHALEELMSWLTHTEELLDAQRPINGDPKVIEVELAKHHVLKNDVLAHQATVETVNKAGNELLESSAGDDDASSLRNRLETMNQCWESVLQKTEEREQQLQSTLQQAQGFHSEIEDFLLGLTRMESQLSSSKPTGGLPETAREQLSAHMELYDQLKAREETYNQLLDKGRLILLSRDDSGSGSKTEQSVALLEQKWHVVSSKMEERKSKLEEVLNLATDFQNSLQEFINWLTLAEQSLNIAPPPSLILNTILSQIDEHKVFANEVNAHRDHIIELDQTGNQLKFLSQKQDVVLIKNLLVSVQSRWEKVVQRSVERGRSLDDARKRAKQFHEAWKKLIDWLEDAENHLDSELEISNDPDKIKLQLSRHKEFQKTLGGKQPVYDTTIRTGRALKEKTSLPDDAQKLDNCLGEVRDKWDTVCGKSVERQHKLEEALLFSGQFMDALQALVDWLYKVEPQLAEDQPVHGDLDLVMNLMDAHKVFQKELGKRTGTVQVLKRSGRELIENSRDDTTWVRVQLQELSTRWDTVCKLSVSKQTRLEHALKQAEEFRNAVHMLLEWLSEAEQTLRFRGALPDDTEALQSLIDVHKEFMKKVEEKRVDVNAAVAMGEVILAVCHPDCVTTIKHWITIIRARFEEVLTWAKQHQQRLEAALSELVANAELLEELLAWIQWAETTLIQRDQEPTPQNIDRVKSLISEHQAFMEEMTRKQPDVDRVTKTYKRKAIEPTHAPFIEKSRSNRKSLGQAAPPPMPLLSQSEAKNPRIHQLSARWQQVWLLALERQRKLNDMLDRLEELKEFANFDFDVWRKKYMRWMNHKKSRVMDFFRRIDKDQDGKITRQEFIDGILASKFPTTKLEMTAVADIFDRDGDGYIDYYEFVAALHPNKDAYRPTTDADKIEDEVTRQVAQCKCAKRFQVEQIGENKYRFFLGNQFGDSQQLRLVRILRSTVMVRVGGGWMALDEFLVKNDPCRARGRTNIELREKFILPEGVSQGMTPFRSRGRRSKPSSRAASPTRSSSSASQSNHSCASMPSSPATPASGAKTPHQSSRCYDKPWLVNSKAGTPLRDSGPPDLQLPGSEVLSSTGSKLKRPAFHSSRTSLTGDASNSSSPVSTSAKTNRADPKKTTSRPTSRAGSRTGSRASSRRGSDASDFDLLETQSACSDTSESSTAGGQGSSRRGLTKPSKIPTMSKKTATASPRTPGPKR
uniref:Microtubule actin crosslinking factor 1 n=1 Tax=Vombatus ursinus TaxID=29139 RepID=A0A4X2K182_VOMUR